MAFRSLRSLARRPFLSLSSWSSFGHLYLWPYFLRFSRESEQYPRRSHSEAQIPSSIDGAITASFFLPVVLSSPFLFRHCCIANFCLFLFIIVYWSPLAHHRFFFTVSSSLIFIHHFSVCPLLSLLRSRDYLVPVLSSLFLRREFSSVFPPHHVFVAVSRWSFLRHLLFISGSLTPYLRLRLIFAICPSQFLNRHFLAFYSSPMDSLHFSDAKPESPNPHCHFSSPLLRIHFSLALSLSLHPWLPVFFAISLHNFFLDIL